MVSRLRLIPFVLAILLLLAILGIEIGSVAPTTAASWLPSFLRGGEAPSIPVSEAIQAFSPEQQEELNKLRAEKADELAMLEPDIEGFGIPYLRFLDVIILFTLGLMTLGLIIPDYVQGKIQGCLTIIFAILLIIAAIVAIYIALAKLFFMVALLFSFPFGTIAYLIIFGSFPREAMGTVLSFLFFLKILFVVVLLIAQQRFVENKGLVIFMLVSFVGNIIVLFLHSFVPRILVSITDAIAAIVVGIVTVILALVLGLGAILSVIFALKPL
ncbi:MAG: hypothetical protein AAF614_41500 [Chloroflexota bacterium]